MVLRHLRIISTFALFFLVLVAAQISCTELRGPGIMPQVSDNDFGPWKVVEKKLSEVDGGSGQVMWQWRITARYIPEQGDAGLVPLDISATMDGTPVPFTFDAHTQLFESTLPPQPGSGVHRFVIMPSKESSRPFSTLTLDLEKP